MYPLLRLLLLRRSLPTTHHCWAALRTIGTYFAKPTQCCRFVLRPRLIKVYCSGGRSLRCIIMIIITIMRTKRRRKKKIETKKKKKKKVKQLKNKKVILIIIGVRRLNRIIVPVTGTWRPTTTTNNHNHNTP